MSYEVIRVRNSFRHGGFLTLFSLSCRLYPPGRSPLRDGVELEVCGFAQSARQNLTQIWMQSGRFYFSHVPYLREIYRSQTGFRKTTEDLLPDSTFRVQKTYCLQYKERMLDHRQCFFLPFYPAHANTLINVWWKKIWPKHMRLKNCLLLFVIFPP